MTASMTFLITALGGANFWSMAAFWPLECQALFGPDTLKVSLFVLPFGFGIVFGIIFLNVGITLFRGRNREMMAFSR